jgi:GntR family transcriptional repressor for pyruvate dehydrogenase complex
MAKSRTSRRADTAPHVERAYRNLKAGIVEGRYRPGASLSEVGLAAELVTDADIERLRALAGIPMGGGQDYRESEAANVQFHLAIASCARNTLALELIERCLAQVDRFMSLGVNFGQFTENATEAHQKIADAIARHDPDGARALMEEHLDCGSRLMKDALLRGHLAGVGI